MENKDLKDVFRAVKEKKRKEKMERLLVYLSGILLALVFVAVGLNFFSKQDKTVSEPDVKIVKDINQPVSTPVVPPSQTPQPILAEKSDSMQEVKIPSKEEQPKNIQQETIKPEEPKQEYKEEKNQNQQKPAEIQKSEQKITKSEQKESKQPKEELSKHTQQKEKVAQEQKQEQKPNKPIKTDQNIKKPEETAQKNKENPLSAVSSGFFSIQVGAFSTREKAMQETSRYTNAFIIEEGGLYKVLVGRFETDREAREYKNKNNIDGFIKRLRE